MSTNADQIADDLGVLVESGLWLLHVRSDWVHRVNSWEQVKLSSGSLDEKPEACLGAAKWAGGEGTAWDLARLLEIRDTPRNWLILKVPEALGIGGTVALAVGSVMSLRGAERRRWSPLPRSLSVGRPGVLRSARTLTTKGGSQRLVLDLDAFRLWNAEEKQWMQTVGRAALLTS